MDIPGCNKYSNTVSRALNSIHMIVVITLGSTIKKKELPYTRAQIIKILLSEFIEICSSHQFEYYKTKLSL